MQLESKCGLCGIYPKWLQHFATTRAFIVVYGALGTIQAMAFVYMNVSLTTLEKRFKIPSRTTGILMSGNEISQIMSVILIYYGNAGHRPRWIAIGVAFSALSCLVLALPHILYGPGQEALALTHEYLNSSVLSIGVINKKQPPICSKFHRPEDCVDDDSPDTIAVPRLLVFFSQFILGIGTTLYYGLGQTYMDDNTKKKSIPMLLGMFSLIGRVYSSNYCNSYHNRSISKIAAVLFVIYSPLNECEDVKKRLGGNRSRLAMMVFVMILIKFITGITFSLRTTGPMLGFVLSYFCLRMYIDPTLHPIIEDKDPRWLGAWWLGWIILGVLMAVSALLLAMFPSELRKPKSSKKKALNESEVPLKSDQLESQKPEMEKPTLSDFVISTKRIMKNKLFLFNTISGVFYILGSAPFIYFLAKYLEVQYGTSAGGGTVITGPLELMGVVLGFMISGVVISKYKPSARPLLGWNVFIGLVYVLTRLTFMYVKCDTGHIQGVDQETMRLNLTASCNADCNCEQVKFSPVCHKPSGKTFFSACHAGCQKVINDTAFGDCNCVFGLDQRTKDSVLNSTLRREYYIFKAFQEYKNVVTVGPCKQDCFKPYITYTLLSTFSWIVGCSGAIGNVLLSYRCVEPRDKGLAQGVSLMLLSLVALIPGPIIAGWLMDSTCLIWDVSCNGTGNCWMYNKDEFNWVINVSGAGLNCVGLLFDALIFYYSKGLDFYGEEEEEEEEEEAGGRKIVRLNNSELMNTDVPCAKL